MAASSDGAETGGPLYLLVAGAVRRPQVEMDTVLELLGVEQDGEGRQTGMRGTARPRLPAVRAGLVTVVPDAWLRFGLVPAAPRG